MSHRPRACRIAQSVALNRDGGKLLKKGRQAERPPRGRGVQARLLRRTLRRGLPAHQHAGDVVETAGLVGVVDHLLGAGVELPDAALHPQHVADVRVLEHAGEPIGAEQVDVPGLRLAGVQLHVERALLPERPQDDVLLRRDLRLLGRDAAKADVLLDERMIVRQVLQFAVSEESR
jgi:hypothetical protein